MVQVLPNGGGKLYAVRKLAGRQARGNREDANPRGKRPGSETWAASDVTRQPRNARNVRTTDELASKSYPREQFLEVHETKNWQEAWSDKAARGGG